MDIQISGKKIGTGKQIKTEKDLAKHISEQIRNRREQGSFRLKESRQEREERIMQKVRNGQKLTGDELSYLRRINPSMYMRIKRIQIKREVLEQKLEHCKSKKEAQEVFADAMAAVAETDPDRDAIIAAYKDAWAAFKESGQYKDLPETAAVTKEREPYLPEFTESPMQDIEDLYFYEGRAVCFDTMA